MKNAKPIVLRLSAREKIIFVKHLAVMLDAGIPLHEALSVLRDQTTLKSLKYLLGIAIADLADGQLLSASLVKFPSLFDSFFTNTINIGESSGSLSQALRYLEVQLEKSEDLKGKIRSALFYPIIVFVGAIGIGVYLAFFMLPKILPLFTSLNLKLPPTTRLLLAVSAWGRAYWPWIIGSLVALVISAMFLLRLQRIREAAHRFLLWLPLFGLLAQNIQTAQFSRILGTLLQSGIRIVPALRVTANSLTNLVYRRELERIAAALERGESIGSELVKHPRLFSRVTTSMVGIGERTGKLSESLLALAEFMEREIDVTTRNLSTLIEPLTLLFVGALVGFIALAIITPIYQLTQGIHRQ